MFAVLYERYRKKLYVLFPFPDAEDFWEGKFILKRWVTLAYKMNLIAINILPEVDAIAFFFLRNILSYSKLFFILL